MTLFRKLRMHLCGVCLLLVAGAAASHAQASLDSLRLTLEDAEARFLRQNLQLLAQHYGVRADSALIRQARLWDNPTLVVDQNVYVDGQGFFKHGQDENGNPTGQFYIQLQQLIQLGGKRAKAVAVASANAGISQLQFEETMRTLRQTLRKDFYTILQLERNANLYNAELEQISRLVTGMQNQFDAGNVSRKDLLRVQAVEVGLIQERADNLRAMEDTQNDIRTLLAVHDNEYIQPIGDKLSLVPALPQASIEELVGMARKNNPAYLIAMKQVDYQKLNYRYQKSLAVPDLNVGPNYDRASNFAPNYFGLTLGIPLPMLNRNQGNIRAAQFNIQQQETSLQQEDINLANDVRSAYRKLALAVNIATPQTTSFYNDYRQLFTNIIESYRSRQISLLEFIDYLNGYEDIREKQLQQQLNIQLAKEELNYQVGVDVVK
jgi:cobalt-zinc-cadmium efflux system outer membrane protein